MKVLLCLLFLVSCSPSSHNGMTDLEDRPIDPLSVSGKAVVLLFIATDCPISNRFAPEIQRLIQEFKPRGVRFFAVYSRRGESAESERNHLKEYSLPLEAIHDPNHVLAKKAGASITPEAVVFLPAGKRIYRGRIDNRFIDIGKERPAPTRHDLEEVLRAIVSNQSISATETDAVGCSISAF